MVISTEGSDSNTRVQVSFDEVGSKWLILAVANLIFRLLFSDLSGILFGLRFEI